MEPDCRISGYSVCNEHFPLSTYFRIVISDYPSDSCRRKNACLLLECDQVLTFFTFQTLFGP